MHSGSKRFLALKPLALAVGLVCVPGSAVALPEREARPNLDCPLSLADTHRYRRLLELEEAGRRLASDMLIGQLDSDLLVGWVLAQRYLDDTFTPDYGQLRDWLERYRDHPDAPRIHQLALERRPEGKATEATKPPTEPSRAAPEPPLEPLPEPQLGEQSLAMARPMFERPFYRSDKTLSHADYRRLQSLKRSIRANLSKTHLTKTEELLSSSEVTRLFDQFEQDEAYADLAAGWLYHGQHDKAFKLADEIAWRNGERLPLSHWTAGLAAWHQGMTEVAGEHFAHFARSERVSPWNRAAGGYWSARAQFALNNLVDARLWLVQAAAHPRTFYGLLAARRLGFPLSVNLHHRFGGCGDLVGLFSSPAGLRAIALAQIGLPAEAERELYQLEHWAAPQRTAAILALTQEIGLYHFGLQLALRLSLDPTSGWRQEDLDPFLYPMPPLRPQHGFLVDRALLYAVMRQESSFDPKAGSHRGALGLMQLLPRTAAAMDPERQFDGEERLLLFDPDLNVTLGEKYLRRLMGSQRVERSLFRLAAAYNAGPGNLGKWDELMNHQDDPLLFIETLPSLETRLFVERVLTNLWVYRIGMGQASPSLDELALNRWPSYQSLDAPLAHNEDLMISSQ